MAVFTNAPHASNTAVRESCSGAEPDESYIEALRQRLHVVEADHEPSAPEAHGIAEVLRGMLRR